MGEMNTLWIAFRAQSQGPRFDSWFGANANPNATWTRFSYQPLMWGRGWLLVIIKTHNLYPQVCFLFGNSNLYRDQKKATLPVSGNTEYFAFGEFVFPNEVLFSKRRNNSKSQIWQGNTLKAALLHNGSPSICTEGSCFPKIIQNEIQSHWRLKNSVISLWTLVLSDSPKEYTSTIKRSAAA